MPNKRDLSLEQYGISKPRYRELYYFCLQYEDMIGLRDDCYSPHRHRLNIETLKAKKEEDGNTTILEAIMMPVAKGGKSDPTAIKGIKCASISAKIEMIEQAALEAGGELYSWLLEAVTTGEPWETIAPPCGLMEFREMRRKFYYLLDLRK